MAILACFLVPFSCNIFFSKALPWGNVYPCFWGVSCTLQKEESYFHIHFVNLHLFNKKLNPLILGDINYQWLVITIILLLLLMKLVMMMSVWRKKYVCVCMSLCMKTSFGFLGTILLFFYVFMSVVNLLRMKFSL